ERFSAYAKEVARGLVVRHDHGSQYVSDDFQNELRFLGIASSPSFVRSPEGNGSIERFFRTLKEQLLWTRTFRNAEEVRHAVQLWAALYNEQWLIERHGHRPLQRSGTNFLRWLRQLEYVHEMSREPGAVHQEGEGGNCSVGR